MDGFYTLSLLLETVVVSVSGTLHACVAYGVLDWFIDIALLVSVTIRTNKILA